LRFREKRKAEKTYGIKKQYPCREVENRVVFNKNSFRFYVLGFKGSRV